MARLYAFVILATFYVVLLVLHPIKCIGSSALDSIAPCVKLKDDISPWIASCHNVSCGNKGPSNLWYGATFRYTILPYLWLTISWFRPAWRSIKHHQLNRYLSHDYLTRLTFASRPLNNISLLSSIEIDHDFCKHLWLICGPLNLDVLSTVCGMVLGTPKKSVLLLT